MLKKAISIALVTIISTTIAIAAYAQQNHEFPDLKGHWAENTIEWAVEKKMVSGYPDGTFKPNQNVSEAEFLAMLIRSYKPDITASKQGHWADGYYDFAAKLNYPVAGGADVGVRGKAITRLRVAELISASQGVNFDGNDAIRYLYGNQLASGTDQNKLTISSFNGNGTLTRAEAVQFIKNLFDNGKGELLARPQEPTDSSSLPNIPNGDEKTTPTKATGELDLPSYKTPSGWNPPLVKSTATWDPVKDAEILKNELGFVNGEFFNPYGGIQPELAAIGVSGGSSYRTIVLYGWYGSLIEDSPLNKTPYITREVFRFFLPDTNDKLFHIIDDGYMGKDVSEYLNKKFIIDDHEVLIQTPPGGVQVYISSKGKKLDLE
ncbi:S-layer homology domain-containing protein [Paenibacillus hamazuiensis]|uniref:S-layer homology domain-containing protein n=1 Tax=Paenibacillus hamazuiensis TaxID=2936508 RepID=UPI00200C7AAE|nr:S-layer homology domain-containing protein [Paenibacillus hamazuiensis]